MLTDKQIAVLPRRATTYFHPDPELPKHGVRVRPTGPGSYTVIVRDAYGKQRWVKIGSTAEMKIEEARERARVVISRVEAGARSVRPAAGQARHRGRRDRDLPEAARRGARLAHRRRGSAHPGRIRSAALARPAFAEVRRSDVAKLLDAVEDEHGPWVADHTLAALRGVASWYAGRNDDYQLPFTRNMQRVPKEARKRSRILSDDELRRVWQAASEDRHIWRSHQAAVVDRPAPREGRHYVLA